ncbi:MAG: hypothetical protein ACTSXL_05945 [Alphaproteobacteria bacterium]
MKKSLFLVLATISIGASAQYRYPLEGRGCDPFAGPCDSVMPTQRPTRYVPVKKTEEDSDFENKETTKSQKVESTKSTPLLENLENPFFMPKEGQVYSKTTGEIGGRKSTMAYNNNLGTIAGNSPFNIESDTEASLVIVEELGFGITDKIAFYARAGYAQIEREYKNTETGLITLESEEKDGMGITGGLSIQLIRDSNFTLNVHGEYTKSPENYIGGFRDQMAGYIVLGKEKDSVAFALHLGILKNKEGSVGGTNDGFGNEIIEKASTDHIARIEILKQVNSTFSLLFGLDYEALSEETAGGSEDNVIRGKVQLNFGTNDAMLSLFGGYETHSWDKYKLMESGTANIYEYDVKDTKGWLAGIKIGLTF